MAAAKIFGVEILNEDSLLRVKQFFSLERCGGSNSAEWKPESGRGSHFGPIISWTLIGPRFVRLFWSNLRKLLKKLAGTTRLELATSAVTGQRSNQLNYVPSLVFIGLAGNPHVYCTSLLSTVSPVSTVSTPYIQNSGRNGHHGHHAKTVTRASVPAL